MLWARPGGCGQGVPASPDADSPSCSLFPERVLGRVFPGEGLRLDPATGTLGGCPRPGQEGHGAPGLAREMKR